MNRIALTLTWLLFITGIALSQQQQPATPPASPSPKPPPEIVQATKEQVLEYALALTQIESARNRADALRANAILADLQADKQEQGKKAMLDGFMKALGVDPEKYDINIDEKQARIFFTLKKPKETPAALKKE